jgi:chemotaxis family two-component system response regulator Rcp1
MDPLKSLRSVKILLVDDSPSDIRLMRESFRDSLLIVNPIVATDGVEAIEYLEKCKSGNFALPDIILLDLNLPRMSGREVLALIKRDPQLKQIPVLVMTTSSSESDIAFAYDWNANCYIRKPSDLIEYEKVVRAIEDFWFMTVTLPDPFGTGMMPAAHSPISRPALH